MGGWSSMLARFISIIVLDRSRRTRRRNISSLINKHKFWLRRENKRKPRSEINLGNFTRAKLVFCEFQLLYSRKRANWKLNTFCYGLGHCYELLVISDVRWKFWLILDDKSLLFHDYTNPPPVSVCIAWPGETLDVTIWLVLIINVNRVL